MKKIRIAFGCIFYPLMMGRYMLEALLRRDDVEVWSYGPFTGNWIPWAGGMTIPEKYVYQPDFPLPNPPGVPPSLMYGMMEAYKPWEPDVWIEVNAGLQATGRPVSGGPYAVIASDPHVLGHLYDSIRPRTDFFFNMQTPYMRLGDIHLPYAYDPIWHAAGTKPMQDRTYDLSLIGLQYPNRIALVNQLRSKGRNIFFELGRVYDDAREIYHDTKIGFNWSSLQDTTARCFEVMAMGTMPLLNNVPDLQTMFKEGIDYIGFDSMPEAVEKAEWYLDRPLKLQEIADNAMEAVAPHTWDARMEFVLKKVGVLNGE